MAMGSATARLFGGSFGSKRNLLKVQEEGTLRKGEGKLAVPKGNQNGPDRNMKEGIPHPRPRNTGKLTLQPLHP